MKTFLEKEELLGENVKIIFIDGTSMIAKWSDYCSEEDNEYRLDDGESGEETIIVDRKGEFPTEISISEVKDIVAA